MSSQDLSTTTLAFATSHQLAIPPPIFPKLILLDRDGVINEDVGSPGVISPSQLQLTPNAASAIGQLRRKSSQVALVTNQSCVGKGLITKQDLNEIHDELQRKLCKDDKDATWDGLYQCLATKQDNDRRMKPNPGMIFDAMQDFDVKAEECVFVGDTLTDMQAASAAGVRLKILVSTGYGLGLMNGYDVQDDPVLIHYMLDSNMDSVTPFVYAKNLQVASNWLCGRYH